MVMMEAGTTMPPMPRPAMTRRPQSVERLSAVAQARAPVPKEGVSVVDTGRLDILVPTC